jgi:hypothetical protein
MRTVFPSGLSPGKSFSTTSAPSTTTGTPRSASLSEYGRPSARSRSRTWKKLAEAPTMLTPSTSRPPMSLTRPISSWA